ncbi:unnamed protein product [Ambrosiozyma monospora]|uniref:Unnamed protein product n=1 Tax=Ambrosiozyma monospora TaxID=43982 RepID=A0A9W6Z6N6_AMBMO|nr:unnamed protein product [Ambrosiozyma monospora]
MEKVQKAEDWCLFSEDSCPGLTDTYGDEFVKLYNKYEAEGKYVQKVSAQKLWHAILVAQTETGNPFLLYKDACNEKSNQKNLGTIKSSNLCCEIVEYSDDNETAVCNLASVALSMFVTSGSGTYDFDSLHRVTKIVVKNLNKIIDVGAYPTPEASRSNKRHRPVAVGVQGLADTFLKMGYSFGDVKSRDLNIKIFETIYHAALEVSVELAEVEGCYETYEGSPISKGILQFDMWNVKPTSLWDWESLKQRISKFGVRNSLLVALMPTASTSQILGFNECFEPITSNIYSRRVLSGEFQVVNKYLVDDLAKLGLWNEDLKNDILEQNGSIQNIDVIPSHLKLLYRTVWELSQKVVIDMAADRAPFIDQSQSMNLFIKQPTMSKLTSMHFYAWGKGLKTGIYYLRTQAASSAIKFTLDPKKKVSVKKRQADKIDGGDTAKKVKVGTTKKEGEDDEYGIYDDSQVLKVCSMDDVANCSSCSA